MAPPCGDTRNQPVSGGIKVVAFSFFRKDPLQPVIAHLYGRVIAAARQPDFYENYGVADTTQGRLELLELHAMLTMRRLKALPPPADAIGQRFVDAVFEQIEHALREIGMGDTTVPKRMKSIAKGFYGRTKSYDAALDAGDDAELAVTLARNVLDSDTPAPLLARYVRAADQRLCGLQLDDIAPSQPAVAAPSLFPDAAAIRLGQNSVDEHSVGENSNGQPGQPGQPA